LDGSEEVFSEVTIARYDLPEVFKGYKDRSTAFWLLSSFLKKLSLNLQFDLGGMFVARP